MGARRLAWGRCLLHHSSFFLHKMLTFKWIDVPKITSAYIVCLKTLSTALNSIDFIFQFCIAFHSCSIHRSLFSALIQFYHFYVDLFIFEMNAKNDQSRQKKATKSFGIGSKNEVNNNKESVKRLIFITIFCLCFFFLFRLLSIANDAHKMAHHVQWYKSNRIIDAKY